MDQKYVVIPGDKTHELPPLIVRSAAEYASRRDSYFDSVMPEVEDILPEEDIDPKVLEARKVDLAIQLGNGYDRLLAYWRWGDSVLEWTRQCEITFEAEAILRHLLRPDVWPHASRVSFVTLLEEKNVPTGGVAIEKAVGLRLAFRQPPPIDCFSNQFLLYLDSSVMDSVYRTWSQMAPPPNSLLPPERFHFQVYSLDAGV